MPLYLDTYGPAELVSRYQWITKDPASRSGVLVNEDPRDAAGLNAYKSFVQLFSRDPSPDEFSKLVPSFLTGTSEGQSALSVWKDELAAKEKNKPIEEAQSAIEKQSLALAARQLAEGEGARTAAPTVESQTILQASAVKPWMLFALAAGLALWLYRKKLKL